MLQSIRENAQGWIAWVIVIGISIPFALFGIDSYFGGGGPQYVAEVDGQKISERDFEERFQLRRRMIREQFRGADIAKLFDDNMLRNQVLDSMITERMLIQRSGEMGFRVSDQAVRSAILAQPKFQVDGRFDKEQYERFLGFRGMTPAGFEAQQRQEMTAQQLPRGLMASEIVTAQELDASARLTGQKRSLKYIELDASGFTSEAPVDGDAIERYYQEHKATFGTPERVKVAYLVLDSETIGERAVVEDSDLRQLFEAEAERFRVPERRQMRHILVTVGQDADDETVSAAKSRIEQARQRILGGEDFAVVAKEVSEDPGSAANGGDLGMVGRGAMVPAFEEAAFAIAQGELSEPVRSRFGYHLIEVVDIEEEHGQSFEDVREQLLEQARKDQAERLYYDLAERLANLTYENPDSLDGAAEALGLEIQQSDWIERSGGEGVFANPKVVGAAFSDEVLQDGNNSDLIEPEQDALQAVVLRVVEHEEAASKPLDDVREEIIEELRQQRALEAARAKGEEILAALEAGQALDTFEDIELVESGMVERRDAKVPAAILSKAFELPRPAEAGAARGLAELGNGVAVVIVDGVEDGKPVEDEAEHERLAKQLESRLARSSVESAIADMETRAKVERKSVEVGDTVGL